MGVMMKHSCELLIDLEKKLHEVLKRQAQTIGTRSVWEEPMESMPNL